ncbi:hypothetical protein GSU68_05270 [Rathayibacter sp. VKM Ac-2759]|uniref:hypothetical protein n=1 Tax=Rathayibacter sp. VKM Ac-2759 TaxID=2609252 RepID=UPI00131765E7|nr:hypothetical protein [Rathayibacter sp. VKM Ac-2759]QHC66050.1 hypothetical protein GSU68_05270 [Rathayibacter sp. VKM Ac-2759]
MTRRRRLEQSTDVSDLLGFGGGHVRVIGVFFVGANLLLAALNLDWSRRPAGTLAAVVIVALLVALVVHRPRDPLPLPSTLVIAVGAPAATALGWWALEPRGWEGSFATWFLGGTAFPLFALCLRGRILAALLGHLAVGTVTLAWMPTGGHSALVGVESVSRYSILLVCGILFRLGLRYAITRMGEVRAERERLASRTAEADGRFVEREKRVRLVADLAEPLLARVAAGEPYSPALARDAANVEAGIRDGLRAFGLVRDPLASSVRAARLRGVEVVLLDDSDGDLDEPTLDRVAATAARAFEEVGYGRVTVRLLPPGRGTVATIVADTEPGLHLEVV